jgi:hypothetical protein
MGVAGECLARASSHLRVHGCGQVHDDAVVAASGAGHRHNFALDQLETLFLAGDPGQKLFGTNGLCCRWLHPFQITFEAESGKLPDGFR